MIYLKGRTCNQEYFTQQDSPLDFIEKSKALQISKGKRIQHHQTSLTTNAEGTPLIPHGHPHSVFNSVVLQISLSSIFLFETKQKQILFTLEVLDLQRKCEEYINILHNQYPLLTLYISMEHLFNLVNQHRKSIID